MAGFLYFDARADDARLTLTLARTAAIEHGAVVANYTPVVRLTTGDERGRPTAPSCVPIRPTPSTEFAIKARVVVNATGVWADDVRALDEGAHPRSIRPAKGVHVSRAGGRLPCDIAAVIPVPRTAGPSSSCRGPTPTWCTSAPPTPTTRVRSTTLRAPPRTSTTSSRPPTTSRPRS